jgi:H+/Cl- antiporter ClcA
MTTEVDADRPPGQRAVLGLIVLAAAAGAATGVGVVLFLAAEHQLHHLVWEAAPEAFGWSGPTAWWIFAVLLVGALGVAAALRLPGRGGHRPLDGLGFDIGPGAVVSVVLAALVSLTAGAVLGPEAPLLAIGSAVGAVLSGRLPPQVRDVVMAAGGTAALTLVLGNPLVSGLLVLEALVLKGSPGGRRAMLVLIPVLTAMGVGYLIQIGVGDWSGVGESRLAVPGLPAYPVVAVADLLVALPLALLAALTGVAAVRLGTAVQGAGRGRAVPVLIGSALAIAATTSLAMLHPDVTYDLVLFSGQQAIVPALGLTSLTALLVVLLAKAVAFGVSLGSGFRGGQVFPGVFLGVVLGVLAAGLWDALSVSATVAVGIAAAAAAVLRMPFTAVLLAVLLTSGAGLAVTAPAIVGAVVGIIVRAAVDARAPVPVPAGGAAAGHAGH